mmetsp:Transcript_24954/g.53966  ORF Transcript_24954/g.53966 Transcript_24954/m.53966 type:complete len:476 (-) Transcript_24954:68-1495(-)
MEVFSRRAIVRILEENVPLLQEIRKFPRYYFLPFGCVAYSIFVGLYIFFFAVAWFASTEETYISLSSAGGVCSEVESPLSGTYLASKYGIWEGSSAFKYSEAKYEFRFSGLLTKAEGFSALLAAFSTNEVSAFTQTHDIAHNLLAYMHYRKFAQVGGKTQSFALITSPSDVFNARSMYGSLVGEAGFCEVQRLDFDVSTSVLQFSFDDPESDDTKCEDLLGNIAQLQSGAAEFRVRANMNSLSLVAALNVGVVGLETLERVDGPFTVLVTDLAANISTYYDARYEDADLIYCIDSAVDLVTGLRVTLPTFCIGSTGSVLVLPLFTPWDPGCIGCDGGPTSADDDYDDNDDGATGGGCNEVSLLSMFVFVPTDAEGGLSTLLNLMLAYANAQDQLRLAAYKAVVTFEDYSFFDKCIGCSVLWVVMFDESFILSAYHLTLPDLHCSASVESPDFKLLDEPPRHGLYEYSTYICIVLS